MKAARFISLLIVAVHVFGHLASAQSNVVAGRKVLASGTVTLFSRTTYKEPDLSYGKSAFSFKHQVRSDVGREVTRNHYELLYGGINIAGDSDWFSVAMVRGDRSEIKDLGPLEWNEIVNVPPLHLRAGVDEGVRFPGKTETFEESSKGRVTRVAAGHVYLIRTLDSKSDFHVLFRVEELLPSDQVTLSYRVVAPPKPDRHRHHQDVSDQSATPNVTVIQKKWRIDVRNPALDKDPVEAMNERDQAERQRKATERTNETLAERGMPSPTMQVPDVDRTARSRGVQVTYVYELKLKNTADKAIRTLTWEYVFLEPGSDVEVGRRRFVSKVNIGRGKTTNVVMRSAVPPASTIDARQAGKKPREQYSEQIVIQSVEYDDGSVWRRPDQDVSALYQVTLYSYRSYRDWSRTSVNFDTGERGSRSGNLAGFDLTYGNLAVDNNGDWFEVRDPRSMIIDLGWKQWGDFTETPSFFNGTKPRKPLPLSKPKVVDASGDSKEISPYQQFVRVKAGHMYLMKVVRGRKTTYLMLRIDSLVKEDNCVLSWKKVRPPFDELEK